MFKRMQIKMTIYYMTILIIIILSINIATYVVLTAFNKHQLSKETENMLSSINSSEWIEEPADLTFTEPTNADQEIVAEDNAKISNIQFSSLKSSTLNMVILGNYSSSNSGKVEADSEDLLEESEEDEEIIENESVESKESESVESENIESENIESENIESESAESEQNDIQNDEELVNDDDNENDIVHDEDEEFIIEIPASDQIPATIKEIVIPNALKSFSFYFIYSNNNELIRYKLANQNMFDQIVLDTQKIAIGDSPKVLKYGDEKDIFLLSVKMPIVINDQTIGYFTAGRDVTVAYETVNNLLKIIIITSIMGILISFVLGYFIAGRAIRPIQEAYETKQRFVADASHELRTPLSVMMLSAEALKREILPTEQFQQQIVSDISEETSRMAGLVENLLFLARTDSKSLAMNKEVINLATLFESATYSIKQLAENKSISLINQATHHLEVFGDSKLIATVVSILLENAIKYTPKRGRVTITSEHLHQKNNKMVSFVIEDTGIGIPKEEISNIFNRFYRVESSRSKRLGGYGLGLSIAKEIVEKHQGTISVTSVVDQGSRFTVELPSPK